MVHIPLFCIAMVFIGLAIIINEIGHSKLKDKSRRIHNNYYRYEIRDLENEIDALRKFHANPGDYDYEYWFQMLKSKEENLEKLKQKCTPYDRVH